MAFLDVPLCGISAHPDRCPGPGLLWSRAGRGLRLLLLSGLCWAAPSEAQTTGRLATLAYDRALLQETARFGALELAFPSTCAAWPDSLRRTLEAQELSFPLTCPLPQKDVPYCKANPYSLLGGCNP